MSLQDVLGQADLAFYPQVALLIFVAVFMGIAVRLLRAADHEAGYQEAARLPLAELAPARPEEENHD